MSDEVKLPKPIFQYRATVSYWIDTTAIFFEARRNSGQKTRIVYLEEDLRAYGEACRKDEREKCAQVCEGLMPRGEYSILGNVGDNLKYAAKAIRGVRPCPGNRASVSCAERSPAHRTGREAGGGAARGHGCWEEGFGGGAMSEMHEGTLKLITRDKKWVVLDLGSTEMLLTRDQAIRLSNALKEVALRVRGSDE